MPLKISLTKRSIAAEKSQKFPADFLKEIDNRFKEYESGKVKGISLDALEEKARKSYAVKIKNQSFYNNRTSTPLGTGSKKPFDSALGNKHSAQD
jgi:hypothetical protein